MGRDCDLPPRLENLARQRPNPVSFAAQVAAGLRLVAPAADQDLPHAASTLRLYERVHRPRP